MKKLSNLEKAVLEKMLDGHHPVLTALRQQLAVANVLERKFTGVGFLTSLSVPKETPRAPMKANVNCFGDVNADIDGLNHGSGFLLYIKDGFLDALEGYTYDEPWPKVIQKFTLSYTQDNPRNIPDFDL